jgi:hypothetical protein
MSKSLGQRAPRSTTRSMPPPGEAIRLWMLGTHYPGTPSTATSRASRRPRPSSTASTVHW